MSSDTSGADERAQARWRGSFRTDVSIREQFTIRADEIEKVGGSDTGPMPSELLLASLASCMCMAVVYTARKRDRELPDLTVEAHGYHDPDGFRFRSIHVVCRSSVDASLLSRIVKAARNVCYVSNTLKQGCDLSYETGSLPTDGEGETSS